VVLPDLPVIGHLLPLLIFVLLSVLGLHSTQEISFFLQYLLFCQAISFPAFILAAAIG
jgi:hypothetical protein